MTVLNMPRTYQMGAISGKLTWVNPQIVETRFMVCSVQQQLLPCKLQEYPGQLFSSAEAMQISMRLMRILEQLSGKRRSERRQTPFYTVHQQRSMVASTWAYRLMLIVVRYRDTLFSLKPQQER